MEVPGEKYALYNKNQWHILVIVIGCATIMNLLLWYKFYYRNFSRDISYGKVNISSIQIISYRDFTKLNRV